MHVGLLECASKSASEIRVFEALNRGIFEFRSYIYFSKEKSSELVDGYRRKMSPNLGDFFSDKVFPGLYMRQCTHKHLQTSHETQLEGPGIFIILGGSYFYRPSIGLLLSIFVSSTQVAISVV